MAGDPAFKEAGTKSSKSDSSHEAAEAAAVVNKTLLDEHASIDDPVEAPARNAPKNNKSPGEPDGDDMAVVYLPVDNKSILLRLFDPDRKQKPQLWTHIKLVAPGPADQPPPGHIKWRSKDAIAAYCLKCKKQFTYTRGTSKTISRHMQAYHGLVLTEGGTNSPSKRRVGDDGGPAPPLKKRKPDLEQNAVALLKWIVSSFQKWSIVESEGMKAFIGCLSESFVVPTTEELIRLAMELVEKVKLEVRGELKGCKDYSVVCHEFQVGSDEEDESYYTSVGVTFCTEDFERKSLSLGSKAGKYQKETLQSLLDEYSLVTSNITSVTLKSSSDSSHTKDGENEPCVLNKMNELVMEALASKKVIDDLVIQLLTSSTETSGWIRCGSLQAQLPYSASALKTIGNVYSAFQNFAATSSTPTFKEDASWKPTEGDKVLIKVLTAILKPFSDAHKTLSEETFPSIGLTIPVFRRIRDVLAKLHVAEIVEGSKETKAIKVVKDFLKSLLKLFSNAFASILDEDPTTMWTIPLDPRLIHMGGLSDQEKESVTKLLIEKVQKEKMEKKNGGVSGGNSGADKSDGQGKKEKREKSTMGGIFWGDEAGDGDKAVIIDDDAAAYARSNVDRYFTTVTSERRIEDPLTWWNSNQNDFPELSTLARVWLGATAIGPRSDGRSECTEGNVEIIAFLHDNASLL